MMQMLNNLHDQKANDCDKSVDETWNCQHIDFICWTNLTCDAHNHQWANFDYLFAADRLHVGNMGYFFICRKNLVHIKTRYNVNGYKW